MIANIFLMAKLIKMSFHNEGTRVPASTSPGASQAFQRVGGTIVMQDLLTAFIQMKVFCAVISTMTTIGSGGLMFITCKVPYSLRGFISPSAFPSFYSPFSFSLPSHWLFFISSSAAVLQREEGSIAFGYCIWVCLL